MREKLVSALLASLLTFALTYLVAVHTRFLDGMDRGLLNGYFYLRDPGPFDHNPYVSERVRLLGYDEDSIAVIGKWPWQRYVHAAFLDKIERFSPEMVFFDLIFAKPESIPAFIDERLDLEPQAMERVRSTFDAMDGEFATALARYDNVYLDLQLIEEDRSHLPEFYRRRIRRNEEILRDYSLPFDDNPSPVVFNSLEPILGPFVENARPVVINVLADPDGVIRQFPLYYTYRMEDGSRRNLFTVSLALLQRWYRVPKENVRLEPGRVVLVDALAPALNPATRQPRRERRTLGAFRGKVSNPDPPADYRYNDNLYRYLRWRLAHPGPAGPFVPGYALHVQTAADGGLKILDGWEIFQAAVKGAAAAVELVTYRQRDIVIETPPGSFYPVNYAGRQEEFFPDSETGALQSYTPIATGSYHDVYTMPALPDLPDIEGGAVPDGSETLEIERWFLEHCRREAAGIERLARRRFGDQTPEPAAWTKFLLGLPGRGRSHFYHRYLSERNAAPGRLTELAAGYPQWAQGAGQPAGDALGPEKILSALHAVWGQAFERYHDRLIFTGGTATGLGDVQQTPYASMYGVNVIISAFNTVVTENFLRYSIDRPKLELLLLLALCMACGLFYGLANIRLSGLFFLLLFAGTFACSFYLFYAQNLYLRPTPLVIANLVIFVGTVIYKLLTEERDKKFLQATFGNYLAPELIDEMSASRTRPQLGGESRRITAYFTDIESFSKFSEKLTAVQLVELLNEYLSAMTDILIREKGTLDKYEGDAIVAFFGAPLDLPDQALRACCTAVAMQGQLASLRDKWSQERIQEGEPERNSARMPEDQWKPGDRWPRIVHSMRMRIGINCGEIVVGNMGSRMRMNYTMMGDAVNLAARLEAAAKQYGVYTLVSEYTLDQEITSDSAPPRRVAELVEARFLDRIQVVGKTEPVRIYELCAMKGGLSGQQIALFKMFNEAVQHYRRMEWDAASESFMAAARLEDAEPGRLNPSQVYIERCRAFKEQPPVEPGQSWDGVHQLTKK